MFALINSKKTWLNWANMYPASSLSLYGAFLNGPTPTSFSFIYVFMYKFSRIQTRIGGVEAEDVDY